MKRNDRNTKKEHMFLKIWLRTGLPILLISAAALFLVAGLLLSAVIHTHAHTHIYPTYMHA